MDRGESNIFLDDPDILIGIKIELKYVIGLQVVGLTGEDVETMAVIAVEAEVRSHPRKSAVVLRDTVDKTVGQACLGADVLDFPIDRILGVGIRLGKGRGVGDEQEAGAQ